MAAGDATGAAGAEDVAVPALKSVLARRPSASRARGYSSEVATPAGKGNRVVWCGGRAFT